MKKVLVTRKIPEVAVELLKQHFEVEYDGDDRQMSKEELMERVRGKDAVLCLLTDPIDKEVIDAAHGCRIFANYAVGYNNIDVEHATRKGILVTNTPGVLDNATADLTWALLFAAARRVAEGDRYVRDRKFDSWKATLLLGRDITGKTLGVVGGGRIGTNFAKKARGFDMKILYTGRSRSEGFEKETGGTFVSKEELLHESDFVSLHVPLNPETKHYISDAELDMMKDTSVLINTARGPVVDEKALVRALREGKIWAAGLDVFENEPLIEEELYDMKNVVLLPHIGSATIETREEMGLIAARNIVSVLSGERPQTCVNKEVLK